MRAYYFNSPIANIKSMAYTKADEKFLKKLNDIIDSHINDVNLDVDMMADLMNLKAVRPFTVKSTACRT